MYQALHQTERRENHYSAREYDASKEEKSWLAVLDSGRRDEENETAIPPLDWNPSRGEPPSSITAVCREDKGMQIQTCGDSVPSEEEKTGRTAA
jgi:hypothetical protein